MVVTQIACGGFHTGLLFENGQAMFFGANKHNQCNLDLYLNQHIKQYDINDVLDKNEL